MAITGPSGSGKSTLLNTLAGIMRPKSGQILIDGENVLSFGPNHISKYRLNNIGMVFQYPELFPELTALENAALVVRLRGGNGKTAKGLAKAWLERLGVGALAASKPATLSGGEAQRVGIARAFAGNPRLVLADEPTGSLDEIEVAAVASLLLETARMTQSVLVVVTHNPVVAAMTDATFEVVRGALVRKSLPAESVRR